MTPTYETRAPLRLAGVNKEYSFAERMKIPEQWRVFGPHLGAVPGQVGNTAYGAVTDAGREDGFNYMTAVEVSEGAVPPQRFETTTVEAARYAVLHHSGNVASLPQTMEAIHRVFLPTVKDETVFGVIERYGPGFDSATGEGGIDVLVPLK